jgi:hypothetical protein
VNASLVYENKPQLGERPNFTTGDTESDDGMRQQNLDYDDEDEEEGDGQLN